LVDCSPAAFSGSATARRVPRGLGFQVPLCERGRNDVGMASMAVALFLEAQQAASDPAEWPADLIAVGRQSQFQCPTSRSTAHDLGINRKFEDWTFPNLDGGSERSGPSKGFATPTGAVKRHA